LFATTLIHGGMSQARLVERSGHDSESLEHGLMSGAGELEMGKENVKVDQTLSYPALYPWMESHLVSGLGLMMQRLNNVQERVFVTAESCPPLKVFDSHGFDCPQSYPELWPSALSESSVLTVYRHGLFSHTFAGLPFELGFLSAPTPKH